MNPSLPPSLQLSTRACSAKVVLYKPLSVKLDQIHELELCDRLLLIGLSVFVFVCIWCSYDSIHDCSVSHPHTCMCLFQTDRPDSTLNLMIYANLTRCINPVM